MPAKPKRRANGDGSFVRTADGGWRWAFPVTQPDGSTRRVWVRGRTQAECRAKGEQARARAARGLGRPGQMPTLSEHMDRWLTEVVAPQRAPTTRAVYRVHAAHIANALGSRRLDRVGAVDIQRMYRAMGEVYAPGTIRATHAVLRQVMDFARRWHGVVSPMPDVRPPPARAREKAVLTRAQVGRLLAATADSWEGPLWRVLAWTTIRVSEARGLRWEDIDLDTGRVLVRVQLDRRPGGEWHLRPTKTRDVTVTFLSQETCAALRVHRARQAEARLRLGSAWTPLPLVFVKPSGKPYHRWEVATALRRALIAAGLPVVSPHGLRHTTATVLGAHGVDTRHVQQLLGHSDISITARTYIHPDEEPLRRIADLLERLYADPDAPDTGLSAR